MACNSTLVSCSRLSVRADCCICEMRCLTMSISSSAIGAVLCTTALKGATDVLFDTAGERAVTAPITPSVASSTSWRATSGLAFGVFGFGVLSP
eukprot:1854523-Prymnesium_polylepis.1